MYRGVSSLRCFSTGMLLSQSTWKSPAGVNAISSGRGVGDGISVGMGVFVSMSEAGDIGLGAGLSVNTIAHSNQ